MGLFASKYEEILSHMHSAGIDPPEAILAVPMSDSKHQMQYHRYRVRGDKYGEKSGAIAWYEDATCLKVMAQDWRISNDAVEILYIHKEKTKRDRSTLLEDTSAEKRAKAIEVSKILHLAHQDKTHSYLQSKGFEGIYAANYGLWVKGNNLIVPLTNGESTYTPSVEEAKRGKGVEVKHHVTACQLIYPNPSDPTRFVKIKKGIDCGKKYFIFGSLKNAKAIYICEGISTGIAVCEASEEKLFCLICTCGCATSDQLYDIAIALDNAKAYERQAQVIICADNDWHRQDNPGMQNAQKIELRLRRFSAKVIVPPVDNVRDDKGVPLTDFCDVAQHLCLEQVSHCLVSCMDTPKPAFLEEYQSCPEYPVIDDYHASQERNKLDMTHFPPMLKEIICVEAQSVHNQNMASYVISKITQDIGLIGSQMYTRVASGKKHCSLMTINLAKTTAGKSYAMDCGKYTSSMAERICLEWYKNIQETIQEKTIELKRLIKQSKRKGDNAYVDDKIEELEEDIRRHELALEHVSNCLPISEMITIQKLLRKISVSRSVLIKTHEYHSFYEALRREGSGSTMNTFLINIFDDNPVRKETKGNGVDMSDGGTASICACSTLAMFSHCVSNIDLKSGFLSRVFFTYISKDAPKKFLPLSPENHVDTEELSKETKASKRVLSLWENAFKHSTRECLSLGFPSKYREGCMFDYSDEKFIAIYDQFGDYLGSLMDGFNGDSASFLARSRDRFITFACYFRLMAITDEEFREKMLVNIEKEIQNKKNDVENNEIKKIYLREEDAMCAASVIKYSYECAQRVYPLFMDGVGRATIESKPSSTSLEAIALADIIREREDKGCRTNNYDSIRLSPEFKKSGMDTKGLMRALDELIERGVIEKCIRSVADKKKQNYKISENH